MNKLVMGQERNRLGCKFFPAFIFLLTISNLVSAVEVSPVLIGRLYGGQYFFNNTDSNLSGDIGIVAAPAVKFNEQWTLIPTISSGWRGTKSVQDLVGGGTLFQQIQDHSAIVKGIYSPDKLWHFKAGGGYHLELLKETNDEVWGHGLFDYQKPSANFEVEAAFSEQASLRAGYDFYVIDFRNFSTLESQQLGLGRNNNQPNVLNSSNHAGYVGFDLPIPSFMDQRAKLDLTYYYTSMSYPGQNIVILTGDLSGDLRSDKSSLASGSLSMPLPFRDDFKVLAEFKAGFSRLDSNQNNYDAQKTLFNPNYYSFEQYSTGPNFLFILGEKPWIFNSEFSYVRIRYDQRPVQDSYGTYGTDQVLQNQYFLNFGLTYPLTKNFKIQALGNFLWSRSNTHYEATYSYNYITSTYLMGVLYEY